MLSDDGVCEVLVKYPGEMKPESCESCKMCGTETTLYSADCTNVLYGRMVDCEPSATATGAIYFPLTAEALGEKTGEVNVPAVGVSTNATAEATIKYDLTVLDTIRLGYGSFVRAPGSWGRPNL